MKLKEIEIGDKFESNKPLRLALGKLQGIVKALNKRELSDEIIVQVNRETEALNSLDGPEKKMLLQIKAAESKILEIVRKKYGLIPEKFYTFLWMPLGMTAFGLPLGTLIFAITGNAAFIGTGLPIGMALGVFLGMTLDNKAKKENKVLVVENV